MNRQSKGRSRLDYKASASQATAKGSAGDAAVKGILLKLGWAQVADLARTYSGADLLAICACEDKHLLWVEAKAYPRGKIEPDSFAHAVARAQEVCRRSREDFALFTYQKPNGGRHKPREWTASMPSLLHEEIFPSQEPFMYWISRLRPSCRPPLPTGDKPSTPAPIATEEE